MRDRLIGVAGSDSMMRILAAFLRVSCAIAAAAVTLVAFAGTNVGGPITVDTSWTLAGAPYTATSDVTVDAGATLTIESGVTVLMNPGTSLVVRNGALAAQGTSTAPIVVTSHRDVANPDPLPAPGDWGQLVFESGTHAARTMLDYVQVRYGRGIALAGASPTLNRVSSLDHVGAAFTLDLASSPVGQGLVATGNTLNGISVPAGDIMGDVKWGLTGIPYVVAQGIVGVGAPHVLDLEPAGPIAIPQGITQPYRVRLSQAAPAGGFTVSVVDNGAATATAPTSVTIAAGETLSVPVFVRGVQSGAGSITLTAPGLAAKTIGVSVLETGSLAFSRTTAPIGKLMQTAPADFAVQLRVGGAAYATPVPVVVDLTSSDPGKLAVPATVAIPAGASAASFTLAGLDLAATLTVDAASPAGYAPPASKLSASVIAPQIALTGLDGTRALTSGTRDDFALQLAVPGDPGTQRASAAIAVGVSITDPAPAGIVDGIYMAAAGGAVVPQLIVPAGGTSVTGYVGSPTIAGTYAVTASIQGLAAVTSPTQTVTAGTLALSLPPKSLVAPGHTRMLTVTLSAAAPAGGVVVALASANASLLSVPASVTVPAGATTATFAVAGVARGLVNVTASVPGATPAVCQVLVSPMTLDLEPQVGVVDIPQGVSQTWQARWVLGPGLGSFAPNDDLPLSLTSADGAIASIAPESLVLPPGQSSAPVTLTGVATGVTTLTLSSPGLPDRILHVNVLGQGNLRFLPGTAVVGKGMTAPFAEIWLQHGAQYYITPVPVTIALANPDPAKATVPASVTVPAFNRGAPFPITGLDLTSSLVVTASTATGYAASPVPIVVQAPWLTFAGLDGLRIAGGGRDQFFVDIGPPPGAYLAQWLVSPATVALSITDATPAGIVSAFHDEASGGSAITQLVFPAGPQNQLTVKGFVGQPTTAGTYTVTGTVSGLATGTSATQTVAASGTLEFMRSSVVVGKGLRVPTFFLTRKANGKLFAPDDALTVTLTNSDAANVTVPITVTIPAKQSSAAFAVTGVGVTSLPAVIDAVATGYETPVKLDVSVVVPRLDFHALDTVRTTGSARDFFWLSWFVPGSELPFQVAAMDVDVALAVTDQSTPGLIDGIYDQSVDGTAITKLVIPAGSAQSAAYGYVGTPTASVGSYTLTATATGIALAVSPVQSVIDATPVVDLTASPLTLGVGMQTDESSLAVVRTVQGYPFYGADTVDVVLTGADPMITDIPEVVTLGAGEAAAPIQATGLSIGDLLLTLAAPGYGSGAAVPVAVVMPELVLWFTEPEPIVTVDSSLQFYVDLVVPWGYPQNQHVVGDVWLTLTSSDPAIGEVAIPDTYIPDMGFQAYSEVMGLAPGTFTVRVEAVSGGAWGAVTVSQPITVVP